MRDGETRHEGGDARLLLVDVDADPLGLGGAPGAIFAVDPASGALTLLHSSRALIDPVDVLDDGAGGLLVLDAGGEARPGAIVRVGADGRAGPLALPEALVEPTSFARAPDGSIWVCDRGETFARVAGPGAVWRFAADLGSVACVASGPPLEVPSDVRFADGAAWVLDADSGRVDVQALAEGALFCAGLDGSGFARAAALAMVSPWSLEAWRDGAFLVADVNGDPKVRTRLCGGVWEVARDGTATLFAWSRELRDPTCATLHAGTLWVSDASADPLGLGDDGTGRGFAGHGRGALFAVDPASRAVRVAAAGAQLCNPARVRVVRGGSGR